MLTHEDKLRYLLSLLWKSPVFGDAFNPSLDKNQTMQWFQIIQQETRQTLKSILTKAMPEDNSKAIDETIAQILPKSIAFCAGTTAGEIANLDKLVRLSLVISIIYWTDQSMDRGDNAIGEALSRFLAVESAQSEIYDTPSVKARKSALQTMIALVEQITLPEETSLIYRGILYDILHNEYQVRLYSMKFSQHPGEEFWKNHAEELAQALVFGSGLSAICEATYALYRHQNPSLPSLEEILSQPVLADFYRGTLNAAARLFDDVGDWRIDTGQLPEWGLFNTNIVNQSHPLLIEAFLKHSGACLDALLYQRAYHLFGLSDEQSRLSLVDLYCELCRQQLKNIPLEIRERYTVFITIAKRILEASFVGMLGDIFLAEGTSFEQVHPQLLQRVIGFGHE